MKPTRTSFRLAAKSQMLLLCTLMLPFSSSAATAWWIPENVKVLRGVRISFSDQCEAFSSTGHWQEFGRINKFGLICFDRSIPISRESIQKELEGVAATSQHPEISHVPFVAIGFSWSSGNAVSVSRAIPERCIALMPSGIGLGVSNDLMKVPMLTVLNEGDNMQNGISAVLQGRHDGAPWGADIRYNGFHSWSNTGMLALLYYDRCARQRMVLSSIAPSAPVTLKNFDERNGWLILRDQYLKSSCPTVVSHAESAANRDNALWFPDEYMARSSASFNVFHSGMFDSTNWSFYPHAQYGPYYPTENTPQLNLISPSVTTNYPTIFSYTSPVQVMLEYTGTLPFDKIEVYDGDMLLKTITSPPLFFQYKNVASGYHGIHAVAYFKTGNPVYSKLGTIAIARPNGIEASFTNPLSSQRIVQGTSVDLLVDAVTDNGSISAVYFFVDGTAAGSDQTAPFSVKWQAGTAGRHIISALAVSSAGDSSRVYPVNVHVVVSPVASSIHIKPREAWIAPGQRQQFGFLLRDQYGCDLPEKPPVTWTLNGGGSIDNTGNLTAAAQSGGPYVLSAKAGALESTIRIFVSNRIRINFQPSYTTPSDGFLVDAGQAYGSRGNGLSYGWDSAPRHIHQRESVPDLPVEYTTFIPMHSQIEPPYNKAYKEYSWEIALASGTYRVRIVAGDAHNQDIALWQTLPRIEPQNHSYKIQAEGTVVVDGKPTLEKPWVEGSAEVTVTDGKLTVSNAAGQNWNKICFIEIIPADDNVRLSYRSVSAQGFLHPPTIRSVAGRFHIASSRYPSRVEIRDLQGRIAFSSALSPQRKIATPVLAGGAYTISIRSGSSHWRRVATLSH